MFTRKFWLLSLVAVILAVSCVCLYAAQQEGFFGSDDDGDFYEEDQKLSKGEVTPYPTEEEDNFDVEVPDVDPSAVVIPTDKPKPNTTTTIPEPEPYEKYEKRSTNTETVINSYGLDRRARDRLIAAHNDAGKAVSKKERLKRYDEIFKKNPNDFLAAYRAAETQMEMGHKGGAEWWLKKVLAINPNYSPAKQLMKKAKNR